MKFTYKITVDVDVEASDLKELGITKDDLADCIIEEINVSSAIPFNTEGDALFVTTVYFDKAK